MHDSIPPSVDVYVCPTCGYWRQERATGVHVTSDPKNPRGPMATHELVEATYIWYADASASGQIQEAPDA